MIELGIFDGDIVVVNRARLPPKHGDVVVAEIDGDFTVQVFYRRNGTGK